MSAEAIIARLSKAKRTGNGIWLACCPAHEDKTPSMSVREVEDGRVLVHCFAGCSVEEILGAIGLDFDELFPPKPAENAAPIRRPFPAADVLEALAFELQVVSLLMGDLHEGRQVSKEDFARLILAKQRIETARDIANGPSRSTFRPTLAARG